MEVHRWRPCAAFRGYQRCDTCWDSNRKGWSKQRIWYCSLWVCRWSSIGDPGCAWHRMRWTNTYCQAGQVCISNIWLALGFSRCLSILWSVDSAVLWSLLTTAIFVSWSPIYLSTQFEGMRVQTCLKSPGGLNKPERNNHCVLIMWWSYSFEMQANDCIMFRPSCCDLEWVRLRTDCVWTKLFGVLERGLQSLGHSFSKPISKCICTWLSGLHTFNDHAPLLAQFRSHIK